MNDDQEQGATSMVRPVDRARAIRLVAFQLHGDVEMWSQTVGEILADDFGLNGKGSLINVLLVLSQDLAGAVADVHGREKASALLSGMLVDLASEGPADA